jgi:PAS domain S-box-containing protein
MSMMVDISERKKAEERARQLLQELQIEKDRLAGVISNIPDEIWFADSNKKFVLANPAACQTFKFDKVENVDVENLAKSLEVYRADMSPRPVEEAPPLRALKGETVREQDEIIRVPVSGRLRYRQVSAAPIKDAAGSIVGSVSVVRDITSSKQAAIQEHLLRKILDLLNQPGSMIDTIMSITKQIKQDTGIEAVGIRLHEGEDYPYYVANGFTEDFLGKERYLCQRDDKGNLVRDERGSPYLECMCGNIISGRTDPKLPFFTEEGSFWTNCTTELLATTTEKDRQARTRNRCNSEGYESVALVPLRSGEKIIGLLQLNDRRRNMFTPELIKFFEGMSTSIGIALLRQKAQDEIKKLNTELDDRVKQRTAELVTANKYLDAFNYSIAHDLKAPLRAISGFSHILAEDYRDKIDAEGKRLVKVIGENTSRMGQLIDDLLALAHVNKLEMQVSDINMTELAQSVCNELKATPIYSDRSIEVSVQALAPARGDLTLVKQILTNLISNSMKFTSRREKALIEVGGYVKGAENVYYVKDNGAGFDMKYVDKLFDVFHRLHAQEEFGGTGIGLVIVDSAVRRNGGTVWAEAEVDKGATFRFTLPKGGRDGHG